MTINSVWFLVWSVFLFSLCQVGVLHLFISTLILNRDRPLVPSSSNNVLANRKSRPLPLTTLPLGPQPISPSPPPSSPFFSPDVVILDISPAARPLTWWAVYTSSIMAAQAQNGTSSLSPPLSVSRLSERPLKSAVCPSTRSLAAAVGQTASKSASPGLRRRVPPRTESSALKVSSQRRLSSLHWARRRLCRFQGPHRSYWSAPCACCAMHATTSLTSWPATTAPVPTACASTCASRSQSPEWTSVARSARSASTPTTSRWSWETGPSWRSTRSSCWGGGWWPNLTAAGALLPTVGKNQTQGIMRATPWAIL